jgi:hypothetical protein
VRAAKIVKYAFVFVLRCVAQPLLYFIRGRTTYSDYTDIEETTILNKIIETTPANIHDKVIEH